MINNENNSSSDLMIDIIENESKFIDVIKQRLGIVVHHHQMNTLHKTILEACQQFHYNAVDCLRKLSTDPEDSPLFEQLIAGITVGETYFFRDKHQMQVLREVLLPQLINSKREKKEYSLRIWSAGCSTGEEIYTLAMMLVDLLPDIANWRLQLLGTDINTKALQKAISGCYGEWSMRSISKELKNKFFNGDSKNYLLSEKVRELVNFGYLNLNDSTYPSLFNGTNAQDLILCRNVLIYFDSARISHLMNKLTKSLVHGGYLLLGASDPIQLQETDLTFHHHLGMVFSRPTFAFEPQILQAFEKKMKTLDLQVQKKHAPVETWITPKKSPVSTQNEDSIAQCLQEGQWTEALSIIQACERDGKMNGVLLNAKACACANLGQLEQSLQASLDSLSLDTTNPVTYFTYALTLTELNRLKEAEDALRKTLFLDHQFVIGHFQLGLLLLRKREHDKGMKSLMNALAIAKAKNPDEPVQGYQALNYGKLSEIFAHEIEMYAMT